MLLHNSPEIKWLPPSHAPRNHWIRNPGAAAAPCRCSSIDDVFGLYLKMLAAMSVVFQMPTFAFFLAKMGMISAGWLWRNLRYAIFVIFVAAAVLTPSSDPWNQTIFALPMIVLYLLSIVIVWMFGPKQARADKI
jgi:sec-independent protein translocase protein TatC